MDTLYLLQRLLLALAIGLLIGIERGWQEREEKEGSRAAGVRTFALIGLLGGVSALLQGLVGGWFLGLSLLAFAGPLALFEWHRAALSKTSSATGTIAGLVAFALGAYAVIGNMVVAGAFGIAATLILAERRLLHSFVERLTWRELRAALLLLTMTFILLPVLPDRTIDPWDAINPRVLWLMVVMIAALSYVGYICVRIAGDRAGLIFGAAAGGLVSSTTVTLNYARLARLHPESVLPLAAGVTTAWAVSLVRMGGVAIVLAPTLALPLGLKLGVPALFLIAATLLFYRRATLANTASPLVLEDPFELGNVLQFGALLAVVMLLSKLLGTPGNGLGLVPLAATSGLVDVDPITLQAARMTGTAITPGFAATIIMVAGGANLVFKSGVALVVGSQKFGAYLLGTAVAAAAAATAIWATIG